MSYRNHSIRIGCCIDFLLKADIRLDSSQESIELLL